MEELWAEPAGGVRLKRGGMRVIRWMIYAMVYLGSILMVYNIYGFIRFARYVKAIKTWNSGNSILHVPIALLICFLLGYLAVGLFGNPDIIMAGILFGGSIFVFIMYKLLSGITQRVIKSERLETELRVAEESNRAKTNFLASMSHEMRTPMNAILGLDAIALQDGALTPQTRDRLEKIDASARHLLDLINDVLDMNHIESDAMHLREEPFQPRETVGLVSVLTQTQCREKRLSYASETSGDLEQLCVGDALRVRQVLLSILDNAVKYTPEGGSVSFRAERLAGADDQHCTLRFTVRDTGIGIDAGFMPRLFESFSQEDASATNRFGGSGLGLAIAKKLVDMMGGSIDVESQKGAGSTFTVTIGFALARPAAAEAADDADDTSLAGLRVLIAEDIDINAELLTDLLDLEDIVSERAVNGQEAVEMFASHPEGYYDAVLMDLRMPVMDGLDATRAIRALDRPDAKAIPVIAVTANAFEEDVRQTREAGMNAHLSKPTDTDLLYHTLRKTLGEKREG